MAPSEKKADDGILNSAGAGWFGAGPVFVAMVPATSWLTRPGGIIEQVVNGAVKSLVYVGTAGASTTSAPTRAIPALATLYVTVAFALSGYELRAGSVAGTSMGNEGGLDNNHPRAQRSNLRKLPLRLVSAHNNLIEQFPAWAAVAAMSAAYAPGNQHIINLLGLVTLTRCFVYYPSYLLDIAPPRSMSHLICTASIINVAWKLATGAM